MEELAVSNNQLQQQLAAAGQAEAQVQQLQAKLSEAEQLKDLVEQLTAENSQVCADAQSSSSGRPVRRCEIPRVGYGPHAACSQSHHPEVSMYAHMGRWL